LTAQFQLRLYAKKTTDLPIASHFLQLLYWGPITYGPPRQILGVMPWPPGHPSIDADDREIRPVGLRFFDEQTATVVLLHYVPPTGRHQAMLRSARPSVCLSHAPSSKRFTLGFWLLRNTDEKPPCQVLRHTVQQRVAPVQATRYSQSCR